MKKLDIDLTLYGSPNIKSIRNFGYDVFTSTNGFSINNQLFIDPFEYKIIDQSNIAESKALFERYLDEFGDRPEYSIKEYEEIEKFMDSITEENFVMNTDQIRRRILWYPRKRLLDFFIKQLAPWFFSIYEDGMIFITRSKIKFSERAAFIRLLYAIANKYPIPSGGGLKALQYWNLAVPQGFLSLILDFLLNFYFPFIIGFRATRMTFKSDFLDPLAI
jgi:hypothetical protein